MRLINFTLKVFSGFMLISLLAACGSNNNQPQTNNPYGQNYGAGGYAGYPQPNMQPGFPQGPQGPQVAGGYQVPGQRPGMPGQMPMQGGFGQGGYGQQPFPGQQGGYGAPYGNPYGQQGGYPPPGYYQDPYANMSPDMWGWG